MKKINISKDWWFCALGDSDNAKKVDLPYDYVIGGKRSADSLYGTGNGFFNGETETGCYWKYIKSTAPHIFLDIDGAASLAEIYVNNNFVGMHPHAYTPILSDISKFIWRDATNKLYIRTEHVPHSMRWYQGGGLYRSVCIWEGGEVRIEPRDVFFHTESITENAARVKTEVTVTSDRNATIDVEWNLCGSKQTKTVSVLAGKTKMEFSSEIPNPKLWDTENPNLHKLSLEIREGDETLDQTELTVGIRKITYSAEEGLKLNGKDIKLKGGCIHHDHGVLGAMAFPAAEERKIRKLKAIGFNSIRNAHNPPSSTLIDVCDREGVLIIDEAFDMWTVGKGKYDYHLFFSDWWARDIEAMVLRDRNHASVFAYSIGNEVRERDGSSDGFEWSKRLSEEVRKYDATRPVTIGVNALGRTRAATDPDDYWDKLCGGYTENCACGFVPGDTFGVRTEKLFAPLDIAGYNYMAQRFETDHEAYPDRVFIQTESWALKCYETWEIINRHPYCLGDFCWTAYDNLGEVGTGRFAWEKEGKIDGLSCGEYPWRMCFQGDYDLAGFRRPQSYLREAVWNRYSEPKAFTTHPCHNGEGFSGTGWHFYDVHHNWNFPDEYLGVSVQTEVYSTADLIVFELNGKIVAQVAPEKGIARTNIPYKRGILKTYAVIDGKTVSSSVLQTTGNAYKIVLLPEKECFKADNMDLCYVSVYVQDEQGNCVETADCEIQCKTEGGEFMGIFSGDPRNEDQYTSDKCHVFAGKAVLIMRSNRAETITITVKAQGLAEGSCKVFAKA